MAAYHLGGKFEQNGEDNTDTQNPQGFIGLVGNDAVVHVHDIQRADQSEEVDDDGRQNYLIVIAAETPNDFPKPCFGKVVFGQFGTRVRRHFGLDKPAVTQIQTGKLVMIKLLLQAIYLTDMIFSVSTRAFDIGNDGSLFVVKNDHHRNGKRRNVFQIALGQCVFKAMAAQDFDEGMIVDIEFFIPHHLCRQRGF